MNKKIVTCGLLLVSVLPVWAVSSLTGLGVVGGMASMGAGGVYMISQYVDKEEVCHLFCGGVEQACPANYVVGGKQRKVSVMTLKNDAHDDLKALWMSTLGEEKLEVGLSQSARTSVYVPSKGGEGLEVVFMVKGYYSEELDLASYLSNENFDKNKALVMRLRLGEGGYLELEARKVSGAQLSGERGDGRLLRRVTHEEGPSWMNEYNKVKGDYLYCEDKCQSNSRSVDAVKAREWEGEAFEGLYELEVTSIMLPKRDEEEVGVVEVFGWKNTREQGLFVDFKVGVGKTEKGLWLDRGEVLTRELPEGFEGKVKLTVYEVDGSTTEVIRYVGGEEAVFSGALPRLGSSFD